MTHVLLFAGHLRRSPQGDANACRDPLPPSSGNSVGVVPVSGDLWVAEVLEAHDPVVVVFHAPASSPCRAFNPVLEELASGLGGRARVLALDVDENAATARRYDVSSLPTLLMFRRGRLTGRMVGARPMERLLPELLTYLG